MNLIGKLNVGIKTNPEYLKHDSMFKTNKTLWNSGVESNINHFYFLFVFCLFSLCNSPTSFIRNSFIVELYLWYHLANNRKCECCIQKCKFFELSYTQTAATWYCECVCVCVFHRKLNDNFKNSIGKVTHHLKYYIDNCNKDKMLLSFCCIYLLHWNAIIIQRISFHINKLLSNL